jgi:hypothetical protein
MWALAATVVPAVRFVAGAAATVLAMAVGGEGISRPIPPGDPIQPVDPGPGGGSDTPTETPTSTPTETDTGGDGGNGGNGGGGGDGGNTVVDVEWPDPVDWLIEPAFEWTAEQLLSAVETATGYVSTLISGMPAPGEPGDVGSWIQPTNGLWPGVWEATQYSIALAAMLLIVAGTWAFRHSDVHEQRSALKQVVVSTIMVVGTWVIAPLGLHLGAELSLAFAPGGGEFVSTPGNFARFGFGIVLAVVMAALDLAIILIALLVLGAQYFLAHAVVFFWPVGWALRPFGGYLRSVGDFVLYLYGGITTLKVGQSMILRLVFELPWGSDLSGFLGFLATLAGVAFALILFPAAMLRRVTMGSAVGLGMPRGHRARRRTQQMREQVSNVRDRFESSGRGSRSSDASRFRSPRNWFGGGSDSDGDSSSSSTSSSSGSSGGGSSSSDGDDDGDDGREKEKTDYILGEHAYQ